MEDHGPWLVVIYRAPAAPARVRAAMWRRLRAAGAVYLAHSVAVLPMSPPAERLLRRLRNEISQTGGSASLLHADAMAGRACRVRARLLPPATRSIYPSCYRAEEKPG